MKWNGAIVLVYAITVLLGGLIGYLKAGSVISLLTGSFLGALLFASALGLFRSSLLAMFTAIGISGLLTLFFLVRYWMTTKMAPAGMMAIASAVVFLLLLTTKGLYSKKGT